MQYYNPYQMSMQQNMPQIPQQGYMPQQSAQMSSTPNSSITWVQGDVGARAYPISPGSSILLMDSEEQNFYIKSADMTGMPSLKKYAYSEVINEPVRLESKQSYDSKDDIQALRNEIKELKNKLVTIENMKTEQSATGRT
jgi:hypothetical protein